MEKQIHEMFTYLQPDKNGEIEVADLVEIFKD
jgi:hypothetical protein